MPALVSRRGRQTEDNKEGEGGVGNVQKACRLSPVAGAWSPLVCTLLTLFVVSRRVATASQRGARGREVVLIIGHVSSRLVQ